MQLSKEFSVIVSTKAMYVRDFILIDAVKAQVNLACNKQFKAMCEKQGTV